jgi:hypothetical protein
VRRCGVVAAINVMSLTGSFSILQRMKRALTGARWMTTNGTVRGGMGIISSFLSNVISAGFATCRVGIPLLTISRTPCSYVVSAGKTSMQYGGGSLTPWRAPYAR